MPSPAFLTDAVCTRSLLLGLLALGAGALAMGRGLAFAGWGPFLAGAVPVWLFVVGLLRRLRVQEGETGPAGLATALTLGRGWLICALAGFVLAPPRDGVLAWMPAALYTTAALCDLVDGYVARRREEESVVGGRLDVAMDALGLVIAPLAAIRLDRLPPWYLLMGAAYYLFHGGLWLRRRWGLVADFSRVPPSRITRMYAGHQMGLVAATLFPVLAPPATTILATLFMVPSLGLFLRDWLVSIGRLDPHDGWATPGAWRPGGAVLGVALPFARAGRPRWGWRPWSRGATCPLAAASGGAAPAGGGDPAGGLRRGGGPGLAAGPPELAGTGPGRLRGGGDRPPGRRRPRRPLGARKSLAPRSAGEQGSP